MTNPVNVYTLGTGTASLNPVVSLEKPPTPYVTNYPVGQIAIVSSLNHAFILTSKTVVNGVVQATWIKIINSVIPPENAYPITPFVVGPVATAGYQTIQSAIDAAALAGGGSVYIQDGYYTEDLTLPIGVDLIAVPLSDLDSGPANVIIQGNHILDVPAGEKESSNIQGIKFIDVVASSSFFSCTEEIFFNLNFLFCNFSGDSTDTILSSNTANGDINFYSCTSIDIGVFQSTLKQMNVAILNCNGIGGGLTSGFLSLTVDDSTFNDEIIADGDNVISASNSFFNNTINVSLSSYFTFNNCTFAIDLGPMINATNTTAPNRSVLSFCRFNTVLNFDIQGTGSIDIFNTIFTTSTSVDTGLDITTPGSTALGKTCINNPIGNDTSVLSVSPLTDDQYAIHVTGGTNGQETGVLTNFSFADDTVFNPLISQQSITSYHSEIQLEIPAGVSVAEVFGCYTNPILVSNVGNIVNLYGVYADAGVQSFGGDSNIGNAYGGYFAEPVFTRTTASIALYADNISVGYKDATPAPNSMNIQGSLNIGRNVPYTSAALAVTSTTQGIGFPVLTTAEKNAIGLPIIGLVVFDSTLGRLSAYNGTAWT